MATIRPTGYLAHYGFSDEDVLEHYGVKGMKWGKRKKPTAPHILSDDFLADGKRLVARGRATANVASAQAAGARRQLYETSKAINDKYSIGGGWTKMSLKDIRTDPMIKKHDEAIPVYTQNKERASYIKESQDRLDNALKSGANANKAQDDGLKKTENTQKSNVTKKASGLALRGKVKINKLLKSVDNDIKEIRAKHTTIGPGGHKASDVVETVRNKDGSISFKKKESGHKASDVVEAIRNKDGSISFKKKKKS